MSILGRLVLICSLLLAACATDAAIGSMKITDFKKGVQLTGGNGYFDQEIDETTYRVGVKVSKVTPPQRAQAIALKRASQVAIERGFEKLQIVDRKDKVTCSYQNGVNIAFSPNFSFTFRFSNGAEADTTLYDANDFANSPLPPVSLTLEERQALYQRYAAGCR